MDTIRQIISVVNRKRISKIEIFDKTLLSTKDSKFTQLYNAVEKEDVKTDKEAAKLIYGDEDSANYRKLKSRFLKRLLNTLFFLDINNNNKGSNYRYNHYSCTKTLMHAKLLRFFGASQSAAKIIKLKYNDAKKFAYYDILSEYSWFLIQFYSLNGNIKAVEIEKSNYNKFKPIADSESKCQLLFYTSIVEFVNRTNPPQSAIDQLKQGIKDIEKEVEKYPTAVNIFNQQILKFHYFETLHDHENLLKECDKAHEELKQYNYYYITKSHLITFKKLVATLNLKMHDEGLKLFNETKNNYAIGSNNWYNIRKYGALLALHSDNREEAYQIYGEVVHKKAAKYMSKAMKEYWSIIRVYCYFLVKLHNEDHLVEEIHNLKRFKLYAVLNDINIYYRDKDGVNIAILVIEYMFGLINNNYENIIRKIESLRVYRTRYLGGDNNHKRAYIFLGLLSKIEKNFFDPKRIRKNCAKEYNLLVQDSSEHEDPTKWSIHESEIIPYEKLWFYILKILEYNKLPIDRKKRLNGIMSDF